MADVFVSYARGDRPRAALIAQALETEGFSVWWETDSKAAKSAPDAINQDLQDAHCAVICWSKASAKSAAVLADATFAYNAQTLTPVTLQACDPPPPFGMMPSFDLTEWQGEPENEDWTGCLEEVRALVEKGRLLAPAPLPPPPPPPPPVMPPPSPPFRDAPLDPSPAGSKRARNNFANAPAPEKSKPPAPKPRAAPARKPAPNLARFVLGVIISAAVIGAVVLVTPFIAPLVRQQLEAPPVQIAAVTAPKITPPTIPSAPKIVIPSVPPPLVEPVAPPASVTPAIPAPSIKPRPPAKPPSSMPAPASVKPAAASGPTLADMETCMAEIAKACGAALTDFAVNNRLSTPEQKLMGTPLFPDGQKPTEANLRACKAASSRFVIASPVGERACATIRPAPSSSPPPEAPLATAPLRLPPVRPGPR